MSKYEICRADYDSFLTAPSIADQYAMAWAEDRKAHISDSAYLSGANLGAFWVVGSPLV